MSGDIGLLNCTAGTVPDCTAGDSTGCPTVLLLGGLPLPFLLLVEGLALHPTPPPGGAGPTVHHWWRTNSVTVPIVVGVPLYTSPVPPPAPARAAAEEGVVGGVPGWSSSGGLYW